MSNREIVIGTRGSKLALIQTQTVVDDLLKNDPDLNIRVRVIKTRGDRGDLTALGAFVGEIEQALLKSRIDIAVHSLKDMPAVVTAGLKFSAVVKRADAREVLILGKGEKFDPSRNYSIGTGSPRRTLLLKYYYPSVRVTAIRGNVDTRVAMVDSGQLDGVILAAAGIIRIGMQDRITTYLPPDIFIPPPGQGAMAVQIRTNDHEMMDMPAPLDDRITRICTNAEHIILKEISGGCSIPLGAYAECKEKDFLTIQAFYGLNREGRINAVSETFHINDADKIPRQIARELKAQYTEC